MTNLKKLSPKNRASRGLKSIVAKSTAALKCVRCGYHPTVTPLRSLVPGSSTQSHWLYDGFHYLANTDDRASHARVCLFSVHRLKVECVFDGSYRQIAPVAEIHLQRFTRAAQILKQRHNVSDATCDCRLICQYNTQNTCSMYFFI